MLRPSLAAGAILAVLLGAIPATAQGLLQYPFALGGEGSPFARWLAGDWREEYVESDPDELGSLRNRLTNTPDMFGDSLPRLGALTVRQDLNPIGFPRIETSQMLSVAGGGRGVRIGENNKALPADRIHIDYHHFENALAMDAGVRDAVSYTDRSTDDLEIDRVTFGLEKALFDGLMSIEARLPISAGADYRFSGGAPSPLVSYSAGEVGNLSFIFKQVLYAGPRGALSAGIAVETPTGADVRATVGGVKYMLKNDAVHLHPWIGVLCLPSTDSFVHSFVQIDVPTGGNRLVWRQMSGPGDGSFGVYNDQTALYWDTAIGHWLHRNPDSPIVTGLAALFEVHWATTLNDPDLVSGSVVSPGPLPSQVQVTNPEGWFNSVNLTTALAIQLHRRSTLRVAGTFPLLAEQNRFFDGELAVQWTRRY